MFPLQQLHYGCLCGRNDDDAAVLAATHKPPVGWYVHTCGHFERFITAGGHTQLIYNSRRTRTQLIECLLQTDRSCRFQSCGGFVLYKTQTFVHVRKNLNVTKNMLTADAVTAKSKSSTITVRRKRHMHMTNLFAEANI